MIGISEADTFVGLAMISVLLLSLSVLVWYLFKIGWKIRN
jgi:hypothetical protein